MMTCYDTTETNRIVVSWSKCRKFWAGNAPRPHSGYGRHRPS